MRRLSATPGSLCLALAIGTALIGMGAAPGGPGRQYRLVIEGENVVTFIPQVNQPPLNVDYRARIEYIVAAQLGKEAKARGEVAVGEDEDSKPPEKVVGKATKATIRGKSPAESKALAPVSGAVDLSLFSSEMILHQGGKATTEFKIGRNGFQGHLLENSPVFNVSAKAAPPLLQEHLKAFNGVAASLLVDDDFKVVKRRIRIEGAQRGVVETLLAIHTPIPRDAESWDVPTRLALGHAQTASGTLRFEKLKVKDETAVEVLKVKVGGTLKAEGIIAGTLVKAGTYVVTGEQTYNTRDRIWTGCRWSVVVKTELANQAGLTVAQSQGKMTVESRPAADPDPKPTNAAPPKL